MNPKTATPEQLEQLFMEQTPEHRSAAFRMAVRTPWVPTRDKAYVYREGDVMISGRPIRFCPECDTAFKLMGAGHNAGKQFCSRSCAAKAGLASGKRPGLIYSGVKRAPETPEQRIARLRLEIEKLENRVKSEVPHVGR